MRTSNAASDNPKSVDRNSPNSGITPNLVDSVEDMERAAELLKARGVSILRCIGKHGPGENTFLVFKDPHGNNVDIYCEMQQIPNDQPHEPRVWERNIVSFDQWRFARFVVPPPQVVIEQKKGKKS